MDTETAYEQERRETIAQNRKLLAELGLNEGGAATLDLPKKPSPKPKPSASRKRKAPVEEEPRVTRRSARVAGVKADPVQLAEFQEKEEKAKEEQRVRDRRLREQVMNVSEMLVAEDSSPAEQLTQLLASVPECGRPDIKNVKEGYAEKDTDAELSRLKDQFKGMHLAANKKVTTERVYTMLVHPEPSKNLVLVGDKYGQLGVWDAIPDAEVKTEDDEDADGMIWRLQAHAKNSISCMKVDPVNGQRLITSSYDCTLRKLDFATGVSTEVFSFGDNDDMLITHFDLVPAGNEAWLVDKNGGISHADFREKKASRRRWEVQEAGRGAKLGGCSVNPLMPHLLVTAGNDQHLRIWDTRHLRKLTPKASETLLAPKQEDKDKAYLDTHCESSIPYDRVLSYMEGKSGKGLLRASYQHGKSCSAAYWDPFGRRILTTSYDDKLRIFNVNPQQFMFDTPLPEKQFKPVKQIAHNCQTGRWLTILRAQWSQNTEFMPHFSVGNMKRKLDVFAGNGDRIVSLWTDAVTAVPAVTAAHPAHVSNLVGGNTSGRIQLWTSGGEE